MDNRMGKAIRDRRLALGFTQEELAENVDRTASQIGQIERGITKPSVDVLIRIVEFLSLDANTMFNGDEKNDDLRDSLVMLQQIDPTYREFIMQIIRMAYKQSKRKKEEND